MVGYRKNKKVLIWFMLISIIFFTFGFIFFVVPGFAQSSDAIIYDYVILIDTSGSMQDGSPPIFEQVQQVATNFVNKIQDGSNLVIYSFDTKYQEVGFWNNLQPSDKQEINSKLNSMDANGQYTALWDTVCEGLNRMDQLGKTGGQHVQLLISFTDGKDNISSTASKSCIEKYEKMHNEGYMYWIFNAIGGADVPEEIEAKKDIIGIVQSDNPQPIQVVQIQPLTLNLGNLYQTGKSDHLSSCLVFWTSDLGLNGKEITFFDPPQLTRNLPSGNTVQICADGTDCERKIEVSPSTSCLDFSIVNFVNQNLQKDNLGQYELSLPLKVEQNSEQNQTFLVPNSIKIEFSLDLPPTPTATLTSTPTPSPTTTPLPTSTATPPPPVTSITCSGNNEIDFGLIKLNRAKSITVRYINCQINWKDYFKNQSFQVDLQWDKNEYEDLSDYIWLSNGGITDKNIDLDPNNPSFDILVQIPRDDWNKIEERKQSFIGTLVFTPNNVNLDGDVNPESQSMIVKFQIQKPLALWIYILIGGILLTVILLIFIPKIIDFLKPPGFPVVLSYEQQGQEVRINLRNSKPIKVNNKISKIIVGKSSECQVKLPPDDDLPNQYFVLYAEKMGGKIEFNVEPFISMKINELPISVKRRIKNKDRINYDELNINIFLSETN